MSASKRNGDKNILDYVFVHPIHCSILCDTCIHMYIRITFALYDIWYKQVLHTRTYVKNCTTKGLAFSKEPAG